jgi:hypothetical protein
MKNIIFILLLSYSYCAADVQFKPSFSEFSVTYPSKPKVQVFAFTGNDGIDSEAIASELIQGYNVMKAEFTPILDTLPIDAMTDTQIRVQMLDYARHNALTVSHAKVKKSGSVRIGELRGTKIIGDEKIPVTYRVITYYGKKSVLIATVASPSEFYPNGVVDGFLKSITW